MNPNLQVNEDNIVEWTIRTLCRDRCAPELEELYVRMNTALHVANMKAHYDELDLLYAQLNDLNIDPLEIVPAVDQVMRISAERALNFCGVELDENIPFEQLCDVVEVIVNFDPTDTPTILMATLDGCEDVDEAFCKIMEHQGTFEEDTWYQYIKEITPHFTKNTRKVCKDAAEAIDAPTFDAAASADLLKRLSRLVKRDKESLGAEIGSEDKGLGLSTESLYNTYIARIIDSPVEKAVGDIFSLAVISNEAYDVAMESVSACIDDLFYDIDQRRQAEQVRLRLKETYKPIFGDRNA
jgi:hypothetical protein